jgi:hypothetical protein
MVKYKVVEAHGVMVRAGFEMGSKPVGQLRKDELLEGLATRVNERGVTRVRFKGRVSGWASMKAGDGSVLLVAVSGKPPLELTGSSSESSFFSESESEAETETDTETDTETETETDTETEFESESESGTESSASGVSATTQRYKVVEPQGVMVRAGFEMGSKPVGQLRKDELLEGLATRVNERGVTRVHFKTTARIWVLSGWASMKAGDGSVLLVALGGGPASAPAAAETDSTEESEPESKGSESESESESDLDSESGSAASAAPSRGPGAGVRYRVAEPQGVLVRAGFELTSRPLGKLAAHEMVEALEARPNADGVTSPGR